MVFGDFRLEAGEARLWRGGEAVPLSPKAFDLLVFLCARPGRLVTKEELLDGVWGRLHISEGVVKNVVRELRSALADDPHVPRYIETVHRRGYRFIAELAGERPVAGRTPAGAPAIVGRDDLIETLDRRLDEALAGRTAIVFVNGEPGIGKTALIQALVRRAGDRALCLRGQCVEQYGQGEPYLPLLEAIGQLARQCGEDALQPLRRYAPTWLAQLPWLVGEADRERLLRETQGVTKDRMLRELGEFLRAWTEHRPTLLVVEDLHWSDHASLDAVTYLARRRDGARLMILASYRPVDVIVNEHPFKGVRNELLLHGLCQDLPLEALRLADVAAFLGRRFADAPAPDALVQAVYRRTEGLPLFLVGIADEIAARRADAGSGGIEEVLSSLPEGLRLLIELQFDRFNGPAAQWLEAAAVCGDAFAAATLAGVTGTAPAVVEDWCESQVRAGHVLRRHGDDGERYAFIHAYYQELAYARIAPARKAALHTRVGEWIEAAGAAHGNDLAAELAMHFERGRQYQRAALQLHRAAHQALNRHAPREAAALLRRGVELLEQYLPDTLEHGKLKLAMLSVLPAALVATRGYAVPELADFYRRALALAERLGDAQAQYSTLYGMWMFHVTRGELAIALDLAQRLAAMAENGTGAVPRMTAGLALGTTLMFIGDNAPADAWFGRGLELAAGLGAAGDRLSQVYGQDPEATLLALRAIVRNLLGQGGEALSLMQSARARAEAIGHPYTLTFTLFCSVWLHRDRGEPEQVRQYLPRFEELSEAHGFPVMFNTTLVFSGWIAAVADGDPAGIARIRRATDLLGVTGMRLTKPVYLHQLADACHKLGEAEAGLQAVDEAMAEIEFSGERRYQAETWRLRGELLAQAGRSADSEACYDQALAIARSQGARPFELRAAVALAGRYAGQGRHEEAGRVLREACDRVGDGEDCPGLPAARALLARLSA